MISVSCSCGRRFKAEDHHAGKRTRCPVCGNMLVIGQSAVTGPFRGSATTARSRRGGSPAIPAPGRRPRPHRRRGAGAAAGVGAGAGATPTNSPRWSSPPRPPRLATTPARGMARPPAGGPGRATLLTGLIGGLVATGILGLAALAWFLRAGDGHGAAPLPAGRASSPRRARRRPEGRRGRSRPPAEPSKNDGRSAGEAGTTARPPTRRGPRGHQGRGRPDATTPTPRLQLLVPAYFYPSGPGMKAWQHLMADSAKVPIVAIANPSSGPGELEDPGIAGSSTRRPARRA